jgi:type IV pilus assembly protein PilX
MGTDMKSSNLAHSFDRPMYRSTHPLTRWQRGVTLIIVLIGMVALMLAALALLRSVDASTLIAGNSAFRGAATQIADLGVEAAVASLPSIAASPDTAIAGKYYPNLNTAAGGLTWTLDGLPPTSVWSTAPTVATGVPKGYTVQYIIERLCNGAAPITNTQANCTAPPPPGGQAGQSRKVDGVQLNYLSVVYYRVTVQVNGPHNTMDYVQTVISD